MIADHRTIVSIRPVSAAVRKSFALTDTVWRSARAHCACAGLP